MLHTQAIPYESDSGSLNLDDEKRLFIGDQPQSFPTSAASREQLLVPSPGNVDLAEQTSSGITEVEPLLYRVPIQHLDSILGPADSDEGEYDGCFVFPTKPKMVDREEFAQIICAGCHYRDYGYLAQVDPSQNTIQETKKPNDLFKDLPDFYTSKHLDGFDPANLPSHSKLDLQTSFLSIFFRVLEILDCKYSAFIGTVCNGEKLFVKVQVREAGLRRLAHFCEYVLMMNPMLSRKVLRKPEGTVIVPFTLYDYRLETTLTNPSNLIKIWPRYDTVTGAIDEAAKSLFRPVDRIRLLREGIDLYFNLKEFKDVGVFSDWYPLHQRSLLNTKEMLEWASSSPRVFAKSVIYPLMNKRQVRNYFGEEYAMYFAWLAMYTGVLGIPAFFGVLVFGIQLWRDPHLTFTDGWTNKITLVFTFIIACWITWMDAKWCGHESSLGLQWGMVLPSGTQSMRKQRAEFKSQLWTRDEIRPYRFVKQYRKDEQNLRWFCAMAIMTIAVVLSAVIVNGDLQGLFLKWIAVPESFTEVTVLNIVTVSSLITAAVVKLVEAFYIQVADRVVRFENWQYESDEFDSQIIKRFAFSSLDYFSGMIYIAFAKRYFMNDKDCNVMTELRSQLFAQWGIETAFNIIERYSPQIKHWMNLRKVKDKRTIPDAEKQFYLPIHDGTLDEYMEMVTQLGLVTLFASVFPIIPTLVWFSNHWELRLDASKLVHAYRRPFPKEARGIGAWNKILRLISLFVMFLNIALCSFSTIGHRLTRKSQLQLMVLFSINGMAVREVITYLGGANRRKVETRLRGEATRVEKTTIWSTNLKL